MVIGHIEKFVKTKYGHRSKGKVKLFKVLLDSGAISNIIVDYLVLTNNKTYIEALMFITANRSFKTTDSTEENFTMLEFS